MRFSPAVGRPILTILPRSLPGKGLRYLNAILPIFFMKKNTKTAIRPNVLDTTVEIATPATPILSGARGP